MSNQIQVRRGTDAQRLAVTPNVGEPCFTTDTKEPFLGDGATAGGNLIGATLLVSGADATPGAAGTLPLASPTRFAQMVQRVIAAAGAGVYVFNVILARPTAAGVGPLSGAVVKLYLELPASANPTINVYDSSGTLLKGPITNPAPAAAAYYYVEAAWIGGAWHVLNSNWLA